MTGSRRRNWPRRVRALGDRKTRQDEGVVFVEGIRQVIDAIDGRFDFEAILVDPSHLTSERAWQAIDEAVQQGVEVAQLSPVEFERISSRDNPVGLAATIRWRPEDLRFIDPWASGVYLATDDVRDPGNLGTIIRTADALGAAGVIVHGGTDPGHPAALRSSLGSAFRTPVHTTPTLNELFYWSQSNGIAVYGTSAHGDLELAEAVIPVPVILLLGNEALGLSDATLDRCDGLLCIPMAGSASSLNVAVAAGILLYELQRRLGAQVDD
ncbi:RNA methyltransferase [soil metagenome]